MKNHKILVVDDNVENAERIIDFLNETENNFSFFQALNGKIACSIAEKKQPDLIITDWEMPVMDGIELIKYLKSAESTKEIPIIMCTGVMMKTENLKAALDAGAVDYIRKPVEKLELTARVHSMLKLSDSMKKVKEQNLMLSQHQAEIESQNEKLIELNATKDKFFNIIAHDLKNPFNGILGLTDLIVSYKEKYDLKGIIQYVELINESAHGAFKLLENLLQWARSQTGGIDFKPENFKLVNLVSDVIGLSENMATSKNITINAEISRNLIIFADENMLNTILRNLLTNAIKFTKKDGKIIITATEQDTDIQITVSDTGIGMNEDKMKRLFKISEKVSTLGTEKETGTGLGLILCKEFVAKHGGRIWVESEVGKGSTFKFTIPTE